MTDGHRHWGMALAGLPFFLGGLGFLLFGILPTLGEWRAMQHWQPVQAEVIDAGLETLRGDNSHTYRANAHYRYHWQGHDYDSRRVGLHRMADNLGHWQQDTAAALRTAQAGGNRLRSSSIRRNRPRPFTAVNCGRPCWLSLPVFLPCSAPWAAA